MTVLSAALHPAQWEVSCQFPDPGYHGGLFKRDSSPRMRPPGSACPPQLEFLPGIVILAIITLAPSMGGSTAPWSQSLLMILIAMLAGIFPPKKLEPAVAVVGAGLLGVVGLSFLPAHWGALPEWRKACTDCGIALPLTITPQPTITLEATWLMLAGLLWLGWLTAHSWSREDRKTLVKFLVCGAVLLSSVALIAYYQNLNIPFWLQTERRFGPFPNRNQTGNYFALASIVALALTQDAFRVRSKWAVFWGAGSALLIWGLVLSYSRGAIVIFFLGLLLWVLVLYRSIKKIAIGFSLILILVAGFLLFGGETVKRFTEQAHSDFRAVIWQDASKMLEAAPLLGCGLGNFEAVFPFFRNASIQQQRIIHPESDWLWLGSEMGLLAVVLVFGTFLVLIVRTLPLKRNTARNLRAACGAAAVGFMLHGFIDVSAHRLGTVIPAILLLAIALNPSKTKPHPWVPWIFRFLALGLLMAACFRLVQEPNPKEAIQIAFQEGNTEAAISRATRALERAPLDWELFYLRGAAIATQRRWFAALADFRRANLLEPHSQRLPLAQGSLWLNLNPPLAIECWRELLRRCKPEELSLGLGEIMRASNSTPSVMARMGELVRGNLLLELAYLPSAPPEQVDELVARLLSEADHLSDAQRKSVYLVAAKRQAEKKEYQEAYQLARKGIDSPPLPALKQVPVEESLRAFTADSTNFAAGYGLYQAQIKAGQLSDAWLTLAKANREKNAPRYFRFLAAELCAQTGQWEKAWSELQIYLTLKDLQ